MRGYYGHGTIKYGNLRQSDRLFPRLELTPDFNRGELRLAAEAVLCEGAVPDEIVLRSRQTLEVLAFQ